jgi:hypothetical protein
LDTKLRVFCVAMGVFAAIPSVAAETPSSSGTGFVVNSDGWVLTNAHVLEGCTRVAATGLGDATDIRLDRQNDLAAIRLSTVESQHFLRFRPSAPRLGDDIVAFGYPLAGFLSDSIKVTVGNINSLTGMDNDTRYLQISAPLQPGNSGGPVLDREGNVLGVATGVLGQTFAGATGILPQNVNFAVRSSVAEIFLQSRSIEYHTGEADSASLSTADLSDAVVPGVVQIQCFGSEEVAEAPSAPVEQPTEDNAEPGLTDEQFATLFAITYHFAWSSPNDEALEFIADVYAESVDFYGSNVSHAALLAEKRAFAERWPVRHYSVRPDTMSVVCAQSVCSVDAMVDWFAHSPERQRSSNGVARSEFDVDVTELKISREAGSVVEGQAANASTMLYRWQQQDEQCRGGSGDSPETWEACEARAYTQLSLEAAGWCYGWPGQAGYEQDWRRCNE